MKIIVSAIAIAVMALTGANAATLLQYDFAGALANSTYDTATSTFEAIGILDSNMSRGSGLGVNNAGNSFRGVGFSNNGISTGNTDYIQFTLTADVGSTVTVESLYGNFNGTGTFSASPGVSMAYAYSLDGGTTFTLMSTFVQVGAGNQTYTITGADATALTGVTSVTFRLYASGQTTSGGWGLQSAATAGTIGLQVNGTVAAVPEPTSAVLLLGSVGSVLLFARRRRALI